MNLYSPTVLIDGNLSSAINPEKLISRINMLMPKSLYKNLQYLGPDNIFGDIKSGIIKVAKEERPGRMGTCRICIVTKLTGNLWLVGIALTT